MVLDQLEDLYEIPFALCRVWSSHQILVCPMMKILASSHNGAAPRRPQLRSIITPQHMQ